MGQGRAEFFTPLPGKRQAAFCSSGFPPSLLWETGTKNPPAKPVDFHMRAKPYDTSTHVTLRKYDHSAVFAG